MIRKGAKDIVKSYLKKANFVQLPKKRSDETVSERIDLICSHFQNEEIRKNLPPMPKVKKVDKEKIQELEKWMRDYKLLLKNKVGRRKLIAKLPHYNNPNYIKTKLKKLYIENPSRAGNYAQEHLSFNPFFDYFKICERNISEPFEEYKFLQTGDIISYQFDLCSIDGLYEFKLTKKNTCKED
jgi:hypothetical protein